VPNKEHLRHLVRDNLSNIVDSMNRYLSGSNVSNLKAVLNRIGRGQQLPHWYDGLANSGTFPNLDGKTIGSVLEMILIATLEVGLFQKEKLKFRINPARGVDLPDLDLGIKTPSENFCTSEPFFSAYERIIGSEHDCVALLTDYQDAKKKPPLRVQIIKYRYLTKSQIADFNICALARRFRDGLIKENEARAKKFFRFLAFVNQSDWRAKRIIRMLQVMDKEDAIRNVISESRSHFQKTNQTRVKKQNEPLPEDELKAIEDIRSVSPLHIAILDAADNWVIDTHKDFARMPNDNEWSRLRSGPLDGQIGMSFALQWRYNFGRIFNANGADEDEGG